jgi:hypothetical protein
MATLMESERKRFLQRKSASRRYRCQRRHTHFRQGPFSRQARCRRSGRTDGLTWRRLGLDDSGARVLRGGALALSLLAIPAYDTIQLLVQDVDADDAGVDTSGTGLVSLSPVTELVDTVGLHIRLSAIIGVLGRRNSDRLSFSLSLRDGSRSEDDGHSGNVGLGTGIRINRITGHC